MNIFYSVISEYNRLVGEHNAQHTSLRYSTSGNFATLSHKDKDIATMVFDQSEQESVLLFGETIDEEDLTFNLTTSKYNIEDIKLVLKTKLEYLDIIQNGHYTIVKDFGFGTSTVNVALLRRGYEKCRGFELTSSLVKVLHDFFETHKEEHGALLQDIVLTALQKSISAPTTLRCTFMEIKLLYKTLEILNALKRNEINGTEQNQK